MKNNVIILGTGIAGLVAAWKYKDENVLIIGEELGGQMASEVTLGPRIIQKDENTKQLLFELYGKEFKTKVASIFYTDGQGGYFENPPEGFSEKYAQLSRGSSIVEEHTMSEGKNKIEYYDLDYNKLVKKLIAALRKRKNIKIINGKVIGFDKKDTISFVDYSKKSDNLVAYPKGKLTYIDTNDGDILINTIMLPVFLKLTNLNKEEIAEYETKGKKVYFYKCVEKWNEDFFKALRKYGKTNKGLVYWYCVSEVFPFHRITMFDNHAVLESIYNIDDFADGREKLRLFGEVMGIEKIAEIPKIINSPVNYVRGWRMFGRFAQWDQSIKLNELLEIINSESFYE